MHAAAHLMATHILAAKLWIRVHLCASKLKRWRISSTLLNKYALRLVSMAGNVAVQLPNMWTTPDGAYDPTIHSL